MHGLIRRLGMVATGIDVATLSINYTGTHTDYGVVQMNDGDYRLLAFTSSGTLTIDKPVNCEVCVVGGGANGNVELDSGQGNNSHGGAGAYMKNQVIEAFEGGAVVVGAAQGVSSIGGVSVAVVSGINGGSGAGTMVWHNPATGDGLSKYPFGDSAYSLWAGKPHCAGGAAGGHTVRTTPSSNGTDRYKHYQGGDGGTNGGNGGVAKELNLSAYSINTPGGSGGSYGGGNGGAVASQTSTGGNATYYGSGAGGGGHYEYYTENSKTLAGGSGYQGIVYMRIPVIQ